MALSTLAKSQPYNFQLRSVNYPDPGTYRQHVRIKLFAKLLAVKYHAIPIGVMDSCFICLRQPALCNMSCLLDELSQPARNQDGGLWYPILVRRLIYCPRARIFRTIEPTYCK